MDAVLDDNVHPSELQKFETVFNQQLKRGRVTNECQFEYAFCLVRSRYPGDVKRGITLLEELFQNHPDGRRDYLYYLAIGYARIKEYAKALRHCRNFLEIEPDNQQVASLEKTIKGRMNSAGLQGILAAGGGLIAIGAVVVGGILLAKK